MAKTPTNIVRDNKNLVMTLFTVTFEGTYLVLSTVQCA